MLNLEQAMDCLKTHVTRAQQPCLMFLAFSTLCIAAFATYTFFNRTSARNYEQEITEQKDQIKKLEERIKKTQNLHQRQINWLNRQHQHDKKVITAVVSEAVHDTISQRTREQARKELEKLREIARKEIQEAENLQRDYECKLDRLRKSEATAKRLVRLQNYNSAIADITIPIDLQSFFENPNTVASFIETLNERNRQASSSISSGQAV